MHRTNKNVLESNIVGSINTSEQTDQKSARQIEGSSAGHIPALLAVAECDLSGTDDDEVALRVALTRSREDLRYRDFLIQEANHRFNNAIQLVIGKLSIQAEATAEAVIRDALEAAMNRIQHMNAVQTLLAGSASPEVVDLSLYLQSLSQGVAGSFASERVTIGMDFEILDVAWKREVAVPLGLILVEALTNSFKHAFSHDQNGQIHIKLQVDGSSQMRLEIEDDGCGRSMERRSGALGLGMIEKLAQRVGGEATLIFRPDGTLVRVLFPKPECDEHFWA